MKLSFRTIVPASLVVASLAAGGAALARPSGARAAQKLPSLSDAQRAKIEAAADEEHAARAQLRAALATQIEKGAIDRKTLAPQLDADERAEADAARVVDATLTPAQKKELADARAAHHGERGATRAEHERGAKKALGLSAEQKQQIHARMQAEPHGDRGAARMVDRFDAMTPILTPAQRAQLAAQLRAK